MSAQPLNQERSSLMTVVEIAKELQVSAKTIYYWVTRNEIPFIRIGRHLRFDAARVLEHFERKTLELKPSCLLATQMVILKGRNPLFDNQRKNPADPKKVGKYGNY